MLCWTAKTNRHWFDRLSSRLYERTIRKHAIYWYRTRWRFNSRKFSLWNKIILGCTNWKLMYVKKELQLPRSSHEIIRPRTWNRRWLQTFNRACTTTNPIRRHLRARQLKSIRWMLSYYVWLWQSCPCQYFFRFTYRFIIYIVNIKLLLLSI